MLKYSVMPLPPNPNAQINNSESGSVDGYEKEGIEDETEDTEVTELDVLKVRKVMKVHT
jgi:hypothetical protein